MKDKYVPENKLMISVLTLTTQDELYYTGEGTESLLNELHYAGDGVDLQNEFHYTRDDAGLPNTRHYTRQGVDLLRELAGRTIAKDREDFQHEQDES